MWAFWAFLFRGALRAHPPDRRKRFSREASAAFEDVLARRVAEVGAMAGHRYAARAVFDAVVAGRRERSEARAHRSKARGGALGAATTDLGYAWRRLRRAPGLTASVTLILALGVGANAAVFTVLRHAVLAPLPFPEADRLTIPRWTETSPGEPDTVFSQWSYPKFVEFRDAAGGVFDGLAAYARRSAAVTDPGDAESVPFEFVTPDYFRLLGAKPVVGRFFAPDEEGGATAPGVVVLSHAFWMQRFGGDASALGRTITADGTRLEIVGVAPAGFGGLTGSTELWIPLGQAREVYGSWATEERSMHWFHTVARLRPGVSAEAAEERVAAVAREIDAVESHLQGDDRAGIDVTPLGVLGSNPDARASVWLAMGAALLVLAIAVINVAALLLARGRGERRETAVRLALGAPMGRLVRARLTEGLLLAAVGGSVGILLAGTAMAWLREWIPEYLFRGAGGDVLLVGTSSFGIDPGVAAFGGAVALIAGAVFGVAPTLAQGTVDLAPSLRRGGNRSVVRGDGGRWLVAGQVALSIVLLVGVGLLIGTLQRLHAEQRGFDPEGLLVLRYSVGGPQSRHSTQDAAREFHRTFRDRIQALPGVRSAALGTTPPLSGHFIQSYVQQVMGRAPWAEGERPTIGIHVVDRDFFATAGTELMRGRSFTEAEMTDADPVTVISAMAAEALFPGEDPLGREILVGLRVGDEQNPFRIVGVVEDVLYSSPVAGLMPEMYMPLGVWAPPAIAVLVRAEGDPTALVKPAREILASLDPDIPLWQVLTGHELRRQDVADTRILVVVLGAFAGLAVLLATAGLWAVVSRAVAERRREIGLRVALGARSGEVEALVFRQGLWPVMGGGAVGIVAAMLLAPRLEGVLFGVTPRSPGIFLSSAGLLVAVALLATWLPARRAARVDPMEVLTAD